MIEVKKGAREAGAFLCMLCHPSLLWSRRRSELIMLYSECSEHVLIVPREIERITLDAIASVRSDTPKLRRTSVVTLEGEYQSTLALSIKYCVKGYQFDKPKI